MWYFEQISTIFSASVGIERLWVDNDSGKKEKGGIWTTQRVFDGELGTKKWFIERVKHEKGSIGSIENKQESHFFIQRRDIGSGIALKFPWFFGLFELRLVSIVILIKWWSQVYCRNDGFASWNNHIFTILFCQMVFVCTISNLVLLTCPVGKRRGKIKVLYNEI